MIDYDLTLEIPDGRILGYRDEDHSYRLDGKRMPSASTLVGLLNKYHLSKRGGWIERETAAGTYTAAKQGELDGVAPQEIWERVRALGYGCAKQDTGADRGTIIHTVYERLAKGEPVPNPAEFPTVARAFLPAVVRSWQALKVERLVLSEQIVCHPELWYAGRLDTLAMCAGELTLLDYKSGKGRVWEEAHLQTRLYSMAAPLSLGLKVERIAIIGVNDRGEFEIVECEATEQDARALIHLYRAKARIGRGMTAQRRAGKVAA